MVRPGRFLRSLYGLVRTPSRHRRPILHPIQSCFAMVCFHMCGRAMRHLQPFWHNVLRLHSAFKALSPRTAQVSTMPPRKRTYSEEARRLQQRSLAMTRKAQLQWVGSVLSERLELVPSVIAHLKNCGVEKPAPGSCVKEEAPAPTTTTPCDADGDDETHMARPVTTDAHSDNTSCADPRTPGSSVKSSDADANDSTVCYIPRKYAAWDEVPPDYLITILSTIEPSSLSKAALRALVPPGKKTVRREPLLEILEYTTGEDRAAPVRPSMRRMPDACATFAGMSLDRGRLARDIVLPIDWARRGLYNITLDEDAREIKVGSRLHSHMVTILVADERLVLEDFTIEFNYSDPRSAITHPALASRTMCAVLFAGKCNLPHFPATPLKQKSKPPRDEASSSAPPPPVASDQAPPATAQVAPPPAREA